MKNTHIRPKMRGLTFLVMSVSCNIALSEKTTSTTSKVECGAEVTTNKISLLPNTDSTTLGDQFMYEAGPSNASPYSQCRPVTYIPDSLNQEERRILKYLEQQNRELKQLKREMEAVWSRAQPQESYCRSQDIESFLENQGGQHSHPLENDPIMRSIRLKIERARLQIQLKHLENTLIFYREQGYDPFDASGPCNGQSDDVLDGYRISKRMLLAGFEAMCTNTFNRVVETRQNIDHLTKKIDYLESGKS